MPQETEAHPGRAGKAYQWIRKAVPLSLAVLPTLLWAAYDESDPVVLEAKVKYMHDDNLFRLADGVDPRSVRGDARRADSVIEPRVAARVNLPASRQLLQFDGEVFSPHYLHHDELNYTGWQGLLAWQWQVGSDWQGQLSYGDRKRLSSFEDVLLGVRDLYRTRSADVSANRRLGAVWMVGVNAGGSRERHDARQFNDYDEKHWGVGVTAQTGKGSVFTLRSSITELDYVDDTLVALGAPQRGFTQRGLDLSWEVPVTGLTKAGGNVGWVRWKDKATGSHSNRLVGGVNASWQATERITLDGSYDRSFDDPGQNRVRRIIDTYRVAAYWQYHPKWTFSGEVRYEDRAGARKEEGSIDEQTLLWRLAATYRPHPAVDVNAYVQQQGRDADTASSQYDSTQYGLSAQVRY
ncbi:hypothetical protein N8I74_15110 [Chitiniphilus purpureus]|uniref:Outer membrane beta-barrel protein n=1 Tax=Chitiniphilus purpureus TaxID=2981137 RepID=A0ABY6DJV1_9NEIS|nr:hypothetical protein [Chitiniphilus sp. CD1]UXY14639.1 hypothetical protein N8I74_15110 [Chitiniphilus sp. CD1]